MQIPVLLLDPYRHTKSPVPPSRFKVNIEGVGPITPSHVRLQGDDPISLAVLVDGSDARDLLWTKVADAASELASSLRPQDTVELYAIDGCKLRRYLKDSPINADQLRLGLVAVAATKSYEEQKKTLGPCLKPIPLWDAMLYIASQLEERHGRRILLTVSNGEQGGASETMARLHRLLNAASITLFSVQHGDVETNPYVVQARNGNLVQTGVRGRDSSDMREAGLPAGPALQTQSELSGGLLLGASLHSLPRTLAKTIQLARGRYIVEFPRPPQLGPGTHVITVSIGNTRDFIRPAGISVPPASPEELAKDPLVQIGPPSASATSSSASPEVTTPARDSGPALTANSASAPAAAELPKPISTPPKPKPAPDPLDITDETHPIPADHP